MALFRKHRQGSRIGRGLFGMNAMRYIFFICFFFVIFGSTIEAKDVDTSTIDVLGTAVISENEIEMKEDALQDAFKRAVVVVVEKLLPKEVLTQDVGYIEWRIYNKASKYIQNYRILPGAEVDESSIDGPIYNLPVRAVVSLATLNADLLDLGILLKKEGARFKVLVRLANILEYKEFQSMKDLIEEIDIVNNLSYASFYRGRILLVLDVARGAQSLRERLVRKVPNQYSVAMVGHNMLIIERR